MKKGTVILLGTMMAIGLSVPGWGGGMEIPGVGAKAKGMGGAYRAIAEDWSAAYYNPAGLFYVTESQFTINESITHFRYKYTPDVTYGGYPVGFYDGAIHNKYEVLTNPMAGAYFRLPISGKQQTFGFSIFQTFDKNLTWDVMQPLNTGSTLPTEQIEHNFDAVAINLSTAVELQEGKLAAGISAGVLRCDLNYGGFFLRRNPADPAAPYYSQIASRPNDLIAQWQRADGYGWGFNMRAGLMYKASPNLTVGISGALPSKVTIQGNARLLYYMPDDTAYNSRPDVRPNIDSLNYILTSGVQYSTDARFTTSVQLPAQVGIGAAYLVNEKLTVTGDLQYTLWSYFKGYRFSYRFPSEQLVYNSVLNTWMKQAMAVPVDWKNTLRGAIGLEYMYSDVVRLRAGYASDQTPVEEGTLHPAFYDSGLRHSLNVGLGLVFERFIIEVATEYGRFDKSTESGNRDLAGDSTPDGVVDNLPGTYEGGAFETIAQFTIRF